MYHKMMIFIASIFLTHSFSIKDSQPQLPKLSSFSFRLYAVSLEPTVSLATCKQKDIQIQ